MNTANENTAERRPGHWLHAIEQRKHALGREYRKGLAGQAREGIRDEDYATTMATLERMARNLGWDESQPLEHPFGPGRGRGHRHGGPRDMMRGRRFGPESPSPDTADEA